jgi:molecular chaperone DnaJ
MAKNFYEILGVQSNATDDELKKAFRKIAVECHPDKNPGDKAAEDKFKEASNAYDVLSNPQKKMSYDASLRGGQPGNFAQNMRPEDFIHNVWSDMFGPFGAKFREAARNAVPQDPPGQNVETQYVISFKEAYFGVTKEIEIPDLKNCEGCSGSGATPGSKTIHCGACAGTGTAADIFGMSVRKCPVCRGRKGTPVDPCKICSGQGQKQVTKKVAVTVPAGVATGQTLRMAGQGLPGSPNGDLFLHLNVEQVPNVERRNLDILCFESVDMITMIKGGVHEFQTPWGTKHSLSVNPKSEPLTEIMVRGSGFVDVTNNSNRGNLCVKIVPKIPTGLTGDKLSRFEALINT